MYEKRVKLPGSEGLHARPAGELALCARGFAGDVAVRRVGSPDVADAKSPVALVALALGPGELVEIIAWGPDEREAVDAIVGLVKSWS